VTRLQQLRELRARIDQEIARETSAQRRLGQLTHEASTAQKNPDEAAAHILASCADWYGVSVKALVSPSRRRGPTAARMVAAWVLRTTLGLSYPEIGRLIGKDHSTVMYAVKKVEGDPELRAVGARMLREAMAA
jgi:chromosomal replication initiation ATPase DnaA